MSASRRWFVSAVAGLAVCVAPVRAEVSAVTDAAGSYVRTVIYASASPRNPRIWSASRPRAGFTPLNVRGDLFGDSFPVVGENPTGQRWPWIVWSHFDGTDSQLVWSRWTGGAWSPIAPVEPAPAPGDALDPAIAFSADGRPYLAWLSESGGRTSVEMSVYLATQWAPAFRVSEPGQDATNPKIAVLADGGIQVEYDTAEVHVTKIIRFARPLSITDDTTPFGSSGASATAQTSESPIGKP